jgi:hypothetical protein
VNGGAGVSGKLTDYLNPYEETNLYVNSSLLYDVSVDSNEQRYRHLADVLPGIKESRHYTSAVYNGGGGHILGIKVNAAPTEFAGQLMSGTATRNLNSDMVIKMTMKEVPSTPLIATTFLMASCLIHSDGTARGDLKIKF